MNMTQKKVAVVTGSSKGIGYAIVKGLCQDFPGDVYLTARDESRGLSAVKSLNNLGFYPKFHKLDITDEFSINELKDHLVEKYGGLDILVNNAGIGRKDDLKDPAFAIKTIRVNYFGTRKTCDILFSILRPHARVVNLSSVYGLLCYIAKESLREKLASKALTADYLNELMKRFIGLVERNDVNLLSNWGNSAYIASKVAISALTRIQQREFLDDVREDIVVNSVHPGSVNTDMNRHKGRMTIEEGAVAPLYAALLPETVTTPKGAFIWDNKDTLDWTAPFNKK